MRLPSVIALLGIPLAAAASFDLMLIPSDSGNRVYRHDPTNMIELGSFIGVNNQISVAANNASTTAHVTGSGGTRGVNYATGERIYDQTIPNGITGLSPDGLFLYEGFGTGNVWRYNALTSALVHTRTLGMTAIHGMVQSSSTNLIVIGSNAAGDILLQNLFANSLILNGAITTLLPASSLLAGSDAGQPGVLGYRDTNGNNLRRLAFVYRTFGGTHSVANYVLDANGVCTGTSAGVFSAGAGFSVASAADTVALVSGHAGMFLVGADASGTGTRIKEFGQGSSGTLINDYVTTAVTAPKGQRWVMSNIVAPEPGTMAALGLGLAALIRRRKR